jgi:membrane peptidoglycan carboxypeptidase
VPSQVLGTNNIDVTHLAAAYAGFAARGRYCTPVAITDVTDSAGNEIKVPPATCSNPIDPEIADEVTKILQGVLTNGTGQGMGIGRPAAAKTGTCEAHTCALFAGYTPNLAAAVWYGDPAAPWKHNNPGIYGHDIGRIWKASMEGALKGTKPLSFHTPRKNFGTSAQTRVPNVTGMPVAQALQTLENAGFTVQVSPRAIDSTKPRGTVAYTSPSVGTPTDQGTTVMLFVSNGMGGMPGHPTRPGKGQGKGLPWPLN